MARSFGGRAGEFLPGERFLFLRDSAGFLVHESVRSNKTGRVYRGPRVKQDGSAPRHRHCSDPVTDQSQFSPSKTVHFLQ